MVIVLNDAQYIVEHYANCRSVLSIYARYFWCRLSFILLNFSPVATIPSYNIYDNCAVKLST